MPPSNVEAVSPLYLHLQVCAPDGSVHTHQVPEGQVLVVGSSAACGLRLDSPEIAGMHCTIEFHNSGVTVRDWSTESGTFLDGRQIEEERVEGTAFELRIAGFLIQSRVSSSPLTREPAASQSQQEEAATISENSGALTGLAADLIRDYDAEAAAQDIESSGFQEPREIVSHSSLGEDLPPQTSAGDVSQPGSDSETGHRAGDDGAAADDGTAWDRDFDPWDSPQEDDFLPAAGRGGMANSPYVREESHDDTVQLLQVEIDYLRSELAERDERLRMLEDLAEFDGAEDASEETVTAAEAEKLVGRLEQLLVELDQSDTRIAALTELLQTSEEALQTADEESRQLEGWLCEVDRRVGQWEQEWHAERDVMRNTIAELTEQRDRAEHQLATGATDDASGAARDELVLRLREEYSRLKAEFLKVEQELEESRLRLQNASVTDIEQRIAEAVNDALREERLQLAQENASLARERAALARKQEEIQSQLERQGQTVDSADHKIRAFREHLREIHETEPKRPSGPTLSQRMGKLWRKLEGRPLDTD